MENVIIMYLSTALDIVLGKSSFKLLLRFLVFINPLSANPTKWSNTLKQFIGNLPTNCLSVFNHFVGLALKGLIRDKNLGSQTQ